MKYLFTIAAFFLMGSFANGQSSFTVSGKVTAEANGLPLPAASVFAQNTTLGTVTDAEGNFKLQLPAGGYDLIITYTGYRTESRRISSGDAMEKLNIGLKEKEKELAEVAIISTNEVTNGLAKYGVFFNEEFIGRLADSNYCRIENPEVLHFFFSKKRNRLKVTATDPLIIKNNLLGYNIKYNLDSFTHEYKSQVSTYSGYPLYEEMQGNDAQKQQWETARQAAYKGSLLHLMRSVYNRDLKGQEFEIQFIVNNNGTENAIKIKDPYGAFNYKKDDSIQTVEIIPNQPGVGILFSGEKPSVAYLNDNTGEPSAFQFSMLNFRPNESIVIEQNGYFYDQNDITISGYLTWDKVAQQLPYDFVYYRN
ncbi:MAG: carboxypeptidase-like regulatory domain-containing protein [Ferruginibacter sp.]